MNLPPLTILIPTHDRDGLLERTLSSLAACELPASLRRVVLAENGAKLGAEQLVTRFQDRLPLTYRYTDAGNKSRALNEALAELTDEFVIFYDDDVRIDPGNPAAYARAAAGQVSGTFFGGRCAVDYVTPPPDWLLRYLPLSAKGWSLGEAPCELMQPHALGCNWAAFAIDLKAAGGFSAQRGPGAGIRGQEYDMQERLLTAGVRGRYLPDALVWHYVPPQRCSPEWTLQRTLATAAQAGIELAGHPPLRRWRTAAWWRLKTWAMAAFLAGPGRWLPAERRFVHEHRRAWNAGALRGLQQSRS